LSLFAASVYILRVWACTSRGQRCSAFCSAQVICHSFSSHFLLPAMLSRYVVKHEASQEGGGKSSMNVKLMSQIPCYIGNRLLLTKPLAGDRCDDKQSSSSGRVKSCRMRVIVRRFLRLSCPLGYFLSQPHLSSS